MKYNCRLSTHDDHHAHITDSINVGLIAPTLPIVYSMVSALNPIRDQGMESSCVAETLSCIKEYQAAQECKFSGYLSPQFIYNLRATYPQDGMDPVNAFAILQTIGVCPETAYPYGISLLPNTITPELRSAAHDHLITSFAAISTIDQLKAALYQYGPCAIVFPVYNENSLQFWEPNGRYLLGYHCVTVVGWDQVSFLIRNSWSTHYGNAGYTNYPFSQWGSHKELWSIIGTAPLTPIVNAPNVVPIVAPVIKPIVAPAIKSVIKRHLGYPFIQ
jgi:C1A family cysteine protease